MAKATLATMEDLTTGTVTRHLLKTTSFILVTMIFQTLDLLIDLYWVGRLGTRAVAAVSSERSRLLFYTPNDARQKQKIPPHRSHRLADFH